MKIDPSRNGQWIHRTLAEHEAALTRYAASLLGDTERARDVVQETFLRLCRQPAHKVEAGVKTWLFTTCRRRALDILRKEARMQPLAEASTTALPAKESPPTEMAETDETHQQLRRHVTELPDKQREVIRLKFQAGMTYQQISDVTGHKTGYVGYLIHHGLKTLREKMTAQTS